MEIKEEGRRERKGEKILLPNLIVYNYNGGGARKETFSVDVIGKFVVLSC